MIAYTSENGYTGRLYGESSLSIYDEDGKEVLHTGFRTINTLEELIDFVDEYEPFDIDAEWEMLDDIEREELMDLYREEEDE